MQMLIVDDNHFARKFIIDYLEFNNIDVSVYEASSGQEAKDKIEQNTYDLILLDISMPDINGIEVLKYIREIDKKVKVIITTVVSTEYQAEKAYDLGVSDFFAKPVEMDKLIEWINKIKEENAKQ